MSLMDLASVVLSLSSGSYTVTRRGPSAYDSDGIRTSPTTSTLTVMGSLQPMSGRDLQRLPEGMRTREGKAFFTPTALLTAASGQEPDTISADGDTWEVSVVDRWAELGNYYRVILLKVGA